MSIQVFSGPGSSDLFKVWLCANPGGYYLNVLSSTEGMIHAAACDHLWDKNFEFEKDFTRDSKVASVSIPELTTYAAEHGITLTSCHRKICP